MTKKSNLSWRYQSRGWENQRQSVRGWGKRKHEKHQLTCSKNAWRTHARQTCTASAWFQAWRARGSPSHLPRQRLWRRRWRRWARRICIGRSWKSSTQTPLSWFHQRTQLVQANKCARNPQISYWIDFFGCCGENRGVNGEIHFFQKTTDVYPSRVNGWYWRSLWNYRTRVLVTISSPKFNCLYCCFVWQFQQLKDYWRLAGWIRPQWSNFDAFDTTEMGNKKLRREPGSKTPYYRRTRNVEHRSSHQLCKLDGRFVTLTFGGRTSAAAAKARIHRQLECSVVWTSVCPLSRSLSRSTGQQCRGTFSGLRCTKRKKAVRLTPVN